MLHNPTDMQSARRLSTLAEHASGSTSVGKQVLGGLVIALGVVLIGASVAGFLGTYGFGAPLCACGMLLGLALFEAEVVLTVASSIVAATGLGLTFFAGPGLLRSGKRQGLSQELIDVKEGIEHYEAPLPYVSVM
ncbi:MAG: hypothetical protein ACRCXC_01410 [Legionella sp.]